jgi:uncharacterized membrane protein YuzA (DUF378 family)
MAKLAKILVLVGSLNWILVGLGGYEWDLVAKLGDNWVATTVYIIIGLAGAKILFRKSCNCDSAPAAAPSHEGGQQM